MKKLSTALLPSLIQDDSLSGYSAVVIDVLRATSVMVTALTNAADRILTCESIEEAKRLASADPSETLLCGERGGVPIDGFDLGNSPAEYDRKTVAGKTLIMTTTNGTKALAAVASADEVVTACFLNLSATIDRVCDASDLLIVCAGTDGHITREDVLAAGAIAQRLVEQHGFQSDDDPTSLAIAAWQSIGTEAQEPTTLAQQLAQSTGGRNLQRLGYDADLQRVANIDGYDTVPTRVSNNPIELKL